MAAKRPASGWTVAQEIDFFFAPPTPYQPPGRISRLHLLRRELQDCLVGGEPSNDEFSPLRMSPGEWHRLFATCLVLWAGVDLLSKFYFGKPGGTTGAEFQRFAKRMLILKPGPLSAKRQAEILYAGMRSPMVHAFGLHDAGRPAKGEAATRAPIKVTLVFGENLGYFIVRDAAPNTYDVNFTQLYSRFILSIDQYRSTLKSPRRRRHFRKVFQEIGTISMGSL
jgi:hypothetical protein